MELDGQGPSNLITIQDIDEEYSSPMQKQATLFQPKIDKIFGIVSHNKMKIKDVVTSTDQIQNDIEFQKHQQQFMTITNFNYRDEDE